MRRSPVACLLVALLLACVPDARPEYNSTPDTILPEPDPAAVVTQQLVVYFEATDSALEASRAEVPADDFTFLVNAAPRT
jgi:hypothetical protein